MREQPVPAHVLNRVERHLNRLRFAKKEIERLRDLERRVGQPGRYEFEYRTSGLFPDVEAIYRFLEQFEETAVQNGVDPHEIYGQLGGSVDVPDWSESAWAWRQEGQE
jgi:hypothetical protein